MYPIAVFVFAALTVVGAVTWWRYRRLQRLVRLERATVRLTDAAHHRDRVAFQARIREAMAVHRAAESRDRLLAEAEQIVTAEYARTTHNPHEGDPT